MDPEDVSKYLAQEACAAIPATMQVVRDLSKQATLPEVDACLAKKLQRQTAVGGDSRLLDSTMQYIARFADGSLVPDVRAAYAARTESWGQAATGAAVTYLMRWDAATSRPLLDEMMPGRDPAAGDRTFDLLWAAYPPADGLRQAFRDQLRSAPAVYAGSSAYALSCIGDAKDREFLREQLAVLRTRHPGELTKEEGNLEGELVSAIMNAEDPRDADREQKSCRLIGISPSSMCPLMGVRGLSSVFRNNLTVRI